MSKVSIVGILLILSLVGASQHSAEAQQAHGCFSVDDFGADPSGVTSSDSAVANILAAIKKSTTAHHACIAFGVGNYAFKGRILIAISAPWSATIRGASQGGTQLRWMSKNGGIKVSGDGYSATTVTDLTLATDSANGGTALEISGRGYAPSVLENLFISGTGALQTTPGQRKKSWTIGIDLDGASFVNVRGVTFLGGDSPSMSGTGISVHGSPPIPPAPSLPIVMNVSQSNFIEGQIGILLGDQAQGVTVTQSNFTGCDSGIADVPTGSGLFQLAVSDSQFDVKLDAVSINSTLSYVLIHGNLFAVHADHAGIVVSSNGYGYKFSDNILEATKLHSGSGIVVFKNQPCLQCPVKGAVNCSRGTISGNSFERLTRGVALGEKAHGWNVQSNGYHDDVTPMDSSGFCNLTAGGSR